MKALKPFLVTLALGFAATSCNQNDCEPGDLSAVCNCYEIYAPVCGCDNVTYSNDCHAECAGITDYSDGTCD
jgi:hypothetical protein